MNLYIVERTDEVPYESYSMFICAAWSEDCARSMHPDFDWDAESRWFAAVWTKDIESLDVRYIGVSNDTVCDILHKEWRHG